MATTNPLRLTYDAIRTALLANKDIQYLFLGGVAASVPTIQHLPDYDPEGSFYAPDPDLDSPSPADYPRAKLVFRPERRYWRGQGQEMQDTSDSSTLRVQYIVEISTGHQIQGRLMDACWALWTFASNWTEYFNGSSQILYNGSPCVLYAEPCEMDAIQVDNDQHKHQARGTDQWVMVWGLNVCFVFKTADLQRNVQDIP